MTVERRRPGGVTARRFVCVCGGRRRSGTNDKKKHNLFHLLRRKLSAEARAAVPGRSPRFVRALDVCPASCSVFVSRSLFPFEHPTVRCATILDLRRSVSSRRRCRSANRSESFRVSHRSPSAVAHDRDFCLFFQTVSVFCAALLRACRPFFPDTVVSIGCFSPNENCNRILLLVIFRLVFPSSLLRRTITPYPWRFLRRAFTTSVVVPPVTDRFFCSIFFVLTTTTYLLS